VVYLLFERVLREVGAKELKHVTDAGGVKGSDHAAVGGAKDYGVM
jgi:hypothetical protein